MTFEEAVVLAKHDGWGVELPAGAPVRAVCRCGNVYARDHNRRTCFQCTEYASEIMTSACPYCGDDFTHNANATRLTCGKVECQKKNQVKKNKRTYGSLRNELEKEDK